MGGNKYFVISGVRKQNRFFFFMWIDWKCWCYW